MLRTNRVMYGSEQELRADNQQVGMLLNESWGRPINDNLRNAYYVHLNFVKRLVEAAGNGDKYAVRTTEDLLDGSKQLTQVIKEYEGQSTGVISLAHAMLKESFLHTTAVFKNAVASCIQLTLIEAWDMCTSCWDSYIYVDEDSPTCEPTGKLEISAIKKGVRNNKAIIEGGVTHSRWRFGESVKNGYCTTLFGDSVEWTWRLENCAKFNLLVEFINRLTQAHNEQKVLYLIELYAGLNGVNPDIINVANGNLLPNNPLPSADSINAAINLIHNQTDNQGRPICDNRDFVFVTFNKQRANEIQQLIDTVETRITDPATGDVRIVRGNGVFGNFTVCLEDYGRMVATGVLPATTSAAWLTSWFLFVAPQRLKRNAIEMRHYTGFRTPVLFRKRANTESITGTLLTGHGDFDTMNREIKIMSGYGGAVLYPELMVGSRGDGVDGDTP